MPVRIPLTGHVDGRYRQIVGYALVDDADAAFVQQYRWSLFVNSGITYAVRRVGEARLRHFMHREILGLSRGGSLQVDHLNRNALDNRRANLRLVNQAQQQQNKGAYRQNASGFRGVFRDARNAARPWIAKAVVAGAITYIGSYTTAEAAAAAASAWRLAHMPYATD